MTKAVHVAAAAIFGDDGQLLISRRPLHLHQGGLLEFPGGKLEPGESPEQALVRELEEELGIIPQQFEPLIQIPYDYPDKRVLLDVWRVNNYSGVPEGKEGQALYWLDVDQLRPEEFPAANRPIINALQLPAFYLITPELPVEPLLAGLDAALAKFPGLLVQLRAHHLDDAAYAELACAVLPLCRARNARLILNRAPEAVVGVEADGIHLNRHLLKNQSQELLLGFAEGLVGASCHNQAELELACNLGLDYLLVSPVLATASHPGAETLEWEGFAALARSAVMPVYALGGMGLEMAPLAARHGGQGVASISAFFAELEGSQ